MRKGPHPLPVHLGMIAANMQDIQKYVPVSSVNISESDAVEMMRGIKMYQEHSFVAPILPTENIWSDLGVTIKRPVMDKETSGKYPLLLVPSLINKANILDVSAEKSMLRWLNSRGVETYLLDWGDFKSAEDQSIDIADIVKTKLAGAIRAVSKIHGTPVDVLGYCMGGTLLLLSHCFASEHIRRMILLATPLDFNTGARDFAHNVRILSPNILPIIKDKGHLPAEWVQALFASIDPNGSAQKFANFASMDQDSAAAKLFISVEDWLNDGIDLPKNIACHCIQDWFVDNKISKGDYYIADQRININNIDTKILIIASNNDKIVPLENAVNLHKTAGNSNVDIISLNSGHIGLIVGREAEHHVLNPILNWLAKK